MIFGGEQYNPFYWVAKEMSQNGITGRSDRCKNRIFTLLFLLLIHFIANMGCGMEVDVVI